MGESSGCLATRKEHKNMFSDYDSPVVGFSSISHSKRDAENSATQTSERQRADEGVQSSEMKSVATETEPAGLGPVAYDEQALAEFLNRIAPMVRDELEIDADFSEIHGDECEEESSLVRLNVYEPPQNIAQHKISCLSWNCTGGTLAAAFSAIRHETWCNHESQVVLFRIASPKLSEPLQFLTNSCVTCVQFHAVEPSLLLAGLYNGEIRVWDLRKDNDWEIADSSGEHGMRVVQVGWCAESTCFAAYADGSILLQKISLTSRKLTILERFLITRNHLNSKLPDGDEGLDVMAVGQLATNTLVVGAGGGALLQCTLSAMQPFTSRPEYRDPVTLIYQAHQAVITAVRSGPTDKAFASASSDGQIRVYKVDEKGPQFVVNIKECSLDIFWTNSPSVLGVCGSKNAINFVRVTRGEVLKVGFELLGDEAATVTEAIKNRGIVAVGNACGKVETWRLSLLKHSSY